MSPCRRSVPCTKATRAANARWSNTVSACRRQWDNRPLKWPEFQERVGQTVYLSATPGDYELGLSDGVVEQIIRPTGLVDPLIDVRPVEGQIDDLLAEIKDRVAERTRAGHHAY